VFDRLLKIEQVLTIALIVMMTVVLVLATMDLGWLIIKDMLTPPYVFLDVDELLDIFGLFMLVLIGIELLKSIKDYAREHVIHVELVLIVAMIAIARKVIILDVKSLPPLSLVGIGAIIFALAAAYFLLHRSIHEEHAGTVPGEKPKEGGDHNS
jgi:uncharacterized membrane protein (DUF373 family)